MEGVKGSSSGFLVGCDWAWLPWRSVLTASSELITQGKYHGFHLAGMPNFHSWSIQANPREKDLGFEGQLVNLFTKLTGALAWPLLRDQANASTSTGTATPSRNSLPWPQDAQGESETHSAWGQKSCWKHTYTSTSNPLLNTNK